MFFVLYTYDFDKKQEKHRCNYLTLLWMPRRLARMLAANKASPNPSPKRIPNVGGKASHDYPIYRPLSMQTMMKIICV